MELFMADVSQNGRLFFDAFICVFFPGTTVLQSISYLVFRTLDVSRKTLKRLTNLLPTPPQTPLSELLRLTLKTSYKPFANSTCMPCLIF